MKPSNIDRFIMTAEALPSLSREGLEAVQLKKLNETLARVAARGGAYQGYPTHLDSLDQLQNLPFTTSAMLSQTPGAFLTVSQGDVSRVISGATSGTTGEAKRVFYTESDTEDTIRLYMAGIAEMLSPGERCIICFPFSGPFGLGDLIARAVENLGGIPIKAGFGQTWEELLRLIQETKPSCYIGFPVTLLSALRLYGPDFPIQKALVSGDACPEGVMQELENRLGHPLYPHYGSREMGLAGAITCQAFEGMHLRENHILAEIIDENGNVLPEGESGELVITTIGLEAMPLIRYRTGDFTRFLPPCPCGSCTRRIGPVSRKEGIPAMEALDSLLLPIPGLIDFRARFDGTLHLSVRTAGEDLSFCIREKLETRYPGLSVRVRWEKSLLCHRPMYSGKRFVER